jgi:hypothetical protein
MNESCSRYSEPRFRPFEARDRAGCLALFEANCPVYFAPNEREDYEAFLAARPQSYKVCVYDSGIVGRSACMRSIVRTLRYIGFSLRPQCTGADWAPSS